MEATDGKSMMDLKKWLKNELIKKQNSESNTEIGEKCALIMETLICMNEIKEQDESNECLAVKNKKSEEELQLVQSEYDEMCETHQNDTKKAIQLITDQRESIENDMKTLMTKGLKRNVQSCREIEFLLNLEKMTQEYPKQLEEMQEKSQLVLETEKYKLESMKGFIEDCHNQEQGIIHQITFVEKQTNDEKEIVEKCCDLIKQVEEKIAAVADFENNIIPSITKEIGEMQQKVSSAEQLIKEKAAIIDNVNTTIKELNMNLETTQLQGESIFGQINAVKSKREQVNVKGIEGINLADIKSTEEYLAEEKNIQKMRADREQLDIDIKNTKKHQEELQKELEGLKIDNNDGQVTEYSSKIELIKKGIQEKQAEYEILMNANGELTEFKEGLKEEKEKLVSEIEDMVNEYQRVIKKNKLNVKKIKAPSPKSKSKPSQPKTDEFDRWLNEPKAPKNNATSRVPPKKDENEIEKWLKELPNKFNSSRRMSQLTNSESNTSFILQSQKDSSDKSIYHKQCDLDIPDPDIIDDITDYSFNDSAGSGDNGLNGSFMDDIE